MGTSCAEEAAVPAFGTETARIQQQELFHTNCLEMGCLRPLSGPVKSRASTPAPAAHKLEAFIFVALWMAARFTRVHHAEGHPVSGGGGSGESLLA